MLLRPGESLVFGRAPHAAPDPARSPGSALLALPDCAPHVSRVVGELVIGAERVVLNWLGSGAAQLAGLFDAPGGARRVSLTSRCPPCWTTARASWCCCWAGRSTERSAIC